MKTPSKVDSTNGEKQSATQDQPVNDEDSYNILPSDECGDEGILEAAQSKLFSKTLVLSSIRAKTAGLKPRAIEIDRRATSIKIADQERRAKDAARKREKRKEKKEAAMSKKQKTTDAPPDSMDVDSGQPNPGFGSNAPNNAGFANTSNGASTGGQPPLNFGNGTASNGAAATQNASFTSPSFFSNNGAAMPSSNLAPTHPNPPSISRFGNGATAPWTHSSGGSFGSGMAPNAAAAAAAPNNAAVQSGFAASSPAHSAAAGSFGNGGTAYGFPSAQGTPCQPGSVGTSSTPGFPPPSPAQTTNGGMAPHGFPSAQGTSSAHGFPPPSPAQTANNGMAPHGLPSAQGTSSAHGFPPPSPAQTTNNGMAPHGFPSAQGTSSAHGFPPHIASPSPSMQMNQFLGVPHSGSQGSAAAPGTPAFPSHITTGTQSAQSSFGTPSTGSDLQLLLQIEEMKLKTATQTRIAEEAKKENNALDTIQASIHAQKAETVARESARNKVEDKRDKEVAARESARNKVEDNRNKEANLSAVFHENNRATIEHAFKRTNDGSPQLQTPVLHKRTKCSHGTPATSATGTSTLATPAPSAARALFGSPTPNASMAPTTNGTIPDAAAMNAPAPNAASINSASTNQSLAQPTDATLADAKPAPLAQAAPDAAGVNTPAPNAASINSASTNQSLAQPTDATLADAKPAPLTQQEGGHSDMKPASIKLPKFAKHDIVLISNGTEVGCILEVDTQKNDVVYDIVNEQRKEGKFAEGLLEELSKTALENANKTESPFLSPNTPSLSIGDIVVFPVVSDQHIFYFKGFFTNAGIQYLSFTVDKDGKEPLTVDKGGKETEVVFPAALCRIPVSHLQPVWTKRKPAKVANFVKGQDGWYKVQVQDHYGKCSTLNQHELVVYAPKFRAGDVVLYEKEEDLEKTLTKVRVLGSYHSGNLWKYDVESQEKTERANEDQLFFLEGDTILVNDKEEIVKTHNLNDFSPTKYVLKEGDKELPASQVVRLPKFGVKAVVASTIPLGKLELFQVRTSAFHPQVGQWAYDLLRTDGGMIALPEEALLDVLDPVTKKDASGNTSVSFYLPNKDEVQEGDVATFMHDGEARIVKKYLDKKMELHFTVKINGQEKDIVAAHLHKDPHITMKVPCDFFPSDETS